MESKKTKGMGRTGPSSSIMKNVTSAVNSFQNKFLLIRINTRSGWDINENSDQYPVELKSRFGFW